MSDSLPGFNDERPDPICGVTHLGNGYRAYHPLLMRFTCPDDLSPFGAGGINPYAYCVGDPINRADPSGHVSAGSLFGILAGVIGGVMLGVLTAGLALPATLAIDAAFTVAVTGAAMGIDHQRLSSMGGGDWGVLIGGSVLASVGGAIAGKVLGSLKGARGRPFGGLMMAGEDVAACSAGMDLEQLIKANYPIERQMMKYLNGKSLDQVRLTSKTLKLGADRELALRPLPDMPLALPLRKLAQKWSALPEDTLAINLNVSRHADTYYENMEATTWFRRTLMGEGYNAPSQVFSEVPVLPAQLVMDESPFTRAVMTKYRFPHAVNVAGVSAREFRHELGISGEAAARICSAWQDYYTHFTATPW